MRIFSPTGAEIVATAETAPCWCGIAEDSFSVGPSGCLAFEYDGSGTKVDWDGQTQDSRNGQPVFIDATGKEWTADQLVHEGSMAARAEASFEIDVAALVPVDQLDPEDREVAGGYQVEATSKEAALDQFHRDYPIHTLDHFQITVREPIWLVEAEYLLPVSTRAEIRAPSLAAAITKLEAAEGVVASIWDHSKQWYEDARPTVYKSAEAGGTAEWKVEETDQWELSDG